MTIKPHLVFSLLIHSLLLTFFLSMPIYKSSIDALSFKGFFVYLGSEEGRVSGEPSTKGVGDSAGGREEAENKTDSETALIASRISKETGKEAFKEEEIRKAEPQRQQVVEIIKHGVVEKKVFAAQGAPQEKPHFIEQGKGEVNPLEKEQPQADVHEGLYAQKARIDKVEPQKDGVSVYEGTVLKTMPGFTIIPYEETAGVEILHARREETKETKETEKTKGEHEVEILEKQDEPSGEKVEKEKNQERVEVVEVRKDEKSRKEIEAIKKELYRETGPLPEETTVEIVSNDEKPGEGLKIQGAGEPDEEFIKEEETDAARSGDQHNTMETVRTGAPQKAETGLLVESVKGRMVMPLETKEQDELKVEVEVEEQGKAEANVEIEQLEEAKEQLAVETKEKDEAKVEEQIKTGTQIEIEKETKKDNETKTETENQVKGSDETVVPRVIYFHEETKRTTPAEMDNGLLLKTIPGAMKMPFQIDLPGEAVQGGFMEQTDEKELRKQEEEKEPVQDFVEVEEPFDRVRVEEKFKYLETSEKEKMKQIKGKNPVTRESESEIMAEKIPVKNEEQEEAGNPVLKIVKPSGGQVPPETVQDEKGRDADSKEEGTVKQLSGERSVKQIIAPDNHEIDAGLLLASVPGKTTLPFEEDLILDLPKEKPVGGDEIKNAGDTEDKRPLETTEQEIKEVEINNYPDLPMEREGSDRESKKKTGDEKRGVTKEEATAEYYKKEDVLPETAPFFEKLQEAEEKDVETKEEAEAKVEVEVEQQIKTATQIEAEAKVEAQGKAEAKVEVEKQIKIDKDAETEAQQETEEKAEVRTPQEIDSDGEREDRVTAEIGPELQEESGYGEKEPSFGISIPDVFFKKDIRIEISMDDPEATEISFRLMKKAHPLDEKGGSLNQEEIKLVEDTGMDDALGYKRVFSISKAEKGIYIFMMKNNGAKGYETELLFHIFEGKSGERKKVYKTVELPPNTTLKYKFIIPEAVFWDDEGYFTGTIESSKTLTKFNEKSGLIWSEEKDN